MKKSLIFRNKSFAFLLIATLFTRLGDSIMTIAILWSIYSLTNSPVLVGVVTAVQVLPVIIFSFYSGILADTYDNKKIMISSDFFRFVLLLSLVFTWNYLDGSIQLVIIYSLIFMLSVFSSFFIPSFQATIKNTVQEYDLVNANSLIEVVRNFSNLFGLILGGILVSTIGITNSFIINALTFLISGIFIMMAKVPHHKQVLISKKISHNIKESFQYLKKAPLVLKQSLWYIIIINLSVAPMSIIMTLLAEESKYDSLGLSFLNTSFALGSICGALLASYLLKKFSDASIIFYFIFCYCSFTFLATLFSNNIVLAMLLLLLTGVFSSLILIFVNTFMQKETDRKFIGRISSFRSMALRIPPPILAMAFGFLIPVMGLQMSTLIIQLLTISLALLIKVRYKKGEVYGQ